MRASVRVLLWLCLGLYLVMIGCAAAVLLWIATGTLSLWWVPAPVATIAVSLAAARRVWGLLR